MKEEIERTDDNEYLSQLNDLFQLHIHLQGKERSVYYDRIVDAVTHSDEKVSIIIDGMDQSKLTVPQFKAKKKCTDGTMFLPTHLSAAKVHGEFVYGQFDFMQYKHDSNLTCNVLLKTLLKMEKIPDVLYLQMDNCWRENKNKFVFAFLALLVLLGVFTTIYVNFLMVGHTHEDIDQLFSIFSRLHLHNKDILTLDDLMNSWSKVKESYNLVAKNKLKNSFAVLAENQYDFKSLLEPHINPLRGHSGPHSFEIKLSENGTPVIRYKQWSSDTEYLPENGLEIFKNLPSEKADILYPNTTKIDVQKIKQNVTSIINNPFISSFDDDSKDWWTNFWAKFENLREQITTNNETHELDLLLEKKNLHRYIPTNMSEKLILYQRLEDACDNPVAIMSISRTRPREVQKVSTEIQYETGMIAAVFQKELIPQIPLPIIGKIEKVYFAEGKRWIDIRIWNGSYEKHWVERKTARLECLEDKSIICFNFEFEERKKRKYLTAETVKFLKDKYQMYLRK